MGSVGLWRLMLLLCPIPKRMQPHHPVSFSSPGSRRKVSTMSLFPAIDLPQKDSDPALVKFLEMSF